LLGRLLKRIELVPLAVDLQHRRRFTLEFFVPNVIFTVFQESRFILLLNLTVNILYLFQLVTLVQNFGFVSERNHTTLK
jgi:hypothetical protein